MFEVGIEGEGTPVSGDPMATVAALAAENERLATRVAALVGENAQQAGQLAVLATESASQATRVAALATASVSQATQVPRFGGESTRQVPPIAVPTASAPVGAWQWVSAAPMTMARSAHTATLLRDGRVLLAGGDVGRNPDVDLSSAEIYDPGTNAVSLTGPLNTARHQHSATLLPDGRVLVVGGYHDGFLSSAEIYDPVTSQWTLSQPLFNHGVDNALTVLRDGRVLVTGGNSTHRPSTDVEIFDPTTDTWHTAAPLSIGRNGHAAILLNDGRVLVLGGNGDVAVLVAEIYDPVTDAWTPTGPMNAKRAWFASAPFPDGRVLAAGGIDPASGEMYATAEIYELATGEWNPTGPLVPARCGHSGMVVPDGRVLVIGGGQQHCQDSPETVPLSEVQIYDYESATWSMLPRLQVPRVLHTATLLPDGRVFVAGGLTTEGTYLDSTEVLELDGRLSGSSMSVARYDHTATLLPDGRVLLVGGYTQPDIDTPMVEGYDPASGMYQSAGSLNTARHGHSATLLPDGRILVIGGYHDGWLSGAEIYDPATGQWSITQPIFAHGVSHTATLLQDGRVLVVAGDIQSGYDGPDDRVEIFDPKTDRWQQAAPHENTCDGHTATLLTDGRVLIAGGSADPSIYDPASDTWQPAGLLTSSRYAAQAVRLQDGRVLLIGGALLPQGETILNSVEIYDPTSNTWRTAAPMAEARYWHTTTLLPDGRVLVTGGCRLLHYEPGAFLSSAELYDPVSDTWNALPSLHQARALHTATLLPDGPVFVAGGFATHHTIFDSVEILELAGP